MSGPNTGRTEGEFWMMAPVAATAELPAAWGGRDPREEGKGAFICTLGTFGPFLSFLKPGFSHSPPSAPQCSPPGLGVLRSRWAANDSGALVSVLSARGYNFL